MYDCLTVDRKEWRLGESLCGWVVHEFDTLLDVAFEASLACVEKLLLIVVELRKDVGSLLGPGRL